MSLLTCITFLPLIGALLIAFVPTDSKSLLRVITLGFTLIVAALSLVIWNGFENGTAAAQYVTEHAWFTIPGGTVVHYKLAVDGLSILLVCLTTLIMPIVVISTPGHIKTRVREFMIWLLVMETGMLGVFLSHDLVLFYFFWEISLVPLYFMLGIWGGDRRLYATIKFFLYTLSGSLVMLIAAIALIYHAGSSDIAAVTDWSAAQPLAVQGWLFAGFALAFAIKVPLFPFHTWLADAHTEAPTSGSVLLAAVLLKMGTYGLLRFGIAMFPAAAIAAAPLFMTLGTIGIVYGALLAMAQTDIKRLIACSSVSHLGYVVLGMFALTQAGMRGSVLQMINHGLSTGLLFLLVGMIYERRHTRLLDQFGGVAASMPVFAFFFVIAVLSSVGLPGLNGFVGEWLILLGAFESCPWLGTIAVSGVILGAVYLLVATRKMLFGPLERDENRNLKDLMPREIGLMIPIVLACVWIGVQPNPFLDKTASSIDAVLERVEAARADLEVGQADTIEPATTTTGTQR
ncbi:MAG: NADH-quinone oxidoreductase subunit M [Chlamydiales bacterium]|jgi:NADH-quinone oxidoreductase subunit M